jgi:hypothetical protein
MVDSGRGERNAAPAVESDLSAAGRQKVAIKLFGFAMTLPIFVA